MNFLEICKEINYLAEQECKEEVCEYLGIFQKCPSCTARDLKAQIMVFYDYIGDKNLGSTRI